MLDCLNEHWSRSVKIFPMTVCVKVLRGILGITSLKIQRMQVSSFIMHFQKKPASTSFLEILLLTVLLWGKESIALCASDKNSMVEKPSESRR